MTLLVNISAISIMDQVLLTILGGQNVRENGNFCLYFENSREGPIFKASNES